MGGWVGGCQDAKSCHFVAPFFKLELARFSVKLSIQDGAECGNKKGGIARLTSRAVQIKNVVTNIMRFYLFTLLLLKTLCFL